jgi:hypothetical protein
MKRFWEQLQPTERRWVAVIGVIVFLVLNYIFIWPHFSDWSRAEARMKKAHDLMNLYQAELKNTSTYEKKIKELQSDGGPAVDDDDQAIDLVRFYTSRANSNEVQIINNSRAVTSTNDPFFVNHEMQLNVQGREPQLVNFLYSLGAGNSIVRVRALSLRPDGPHQQINANISIVASYAKRAPARAPTTSPSPAPATAPAKTALPTPPTAAVKSPQPGKAKNPVGINHTNASTNRPLPLTAKRP